MKRKKRDKHVKAIRRKLKKHGAVVIGVHFSHEEGSGALYLDPTQAKRLFFLDNHLDGLPFPIILRDRQEPNVKVWPDLPPAPVTSVPQDDTVPHGIVTSLPHDETMPNEIVNRQQWADVTSRDNTDDH